jgi:hypothetical protein
MLIALGSTWSACWSVSQSFNNVVVVVVVVVVVGYVSKNKAAQNTSSLFKFVLWDENSYIFIRYRPWKRNTGIDGGLYLNVCWRNGVWWCGLYSTGWDHSPVRDLVKTAITVRSQYKVGNFLPIGASHERLCSTMLIFKKNMKFV